MTLQTLILITGSPVLVVILLLGMKWARSHARATRELAALRSLAHDQANALQQSEERYHHLFNATSFGILHYDTNGTILACNTIFAKILGKTPPSAVGLNLFSCIENTALLKGVKDSLQSGEGHFDGDYFSGAQDPTPLRIVFKATRSRSNIIDGGIGVLEDHSERKMLQETIEHHASYDFLTGLPNRQLLLQQLDQELSRAIRHRQHGALLFLDLDNFKTINDSLGHTTGDMLLKQVASRLTTNLRREDITARMGGDEFAILLPALDHIEEQAARKSQDVANKLATAIGSPYFLEKEQLNITPSVGISLFPESGKTASDILKQAGTAMNQAKTAGRNTARFFLPSMQHAAEKRLRLNIDIKKALANDELSVHFQPQVKADGSIVGAEGLIRWTHPERGMISPVDFIPVAEETGIILDIGEWVLRRICENVREWQDARLLADHHTFAVNVSAREFSRPDFVERVIRTIQETGIHPRHLDIELTEGSLVSSVSDTVAKIKALRDFGIKFSVDDFGTGYSSLNYLKRLPLHTLKIDRSFVNDIGPAKTEVMLVEIIITLARNLGLNIVAEGVETAEELQYLAARGCNVYQGYLFCKPVPTAAFRKMLESGGIKL